MEEPSKTAIHPSTPPNYVTLVDLRERWLQKHKQKKPHEEEEQELIPPTVAAAAKELPPNYVSLVDLRERWLHKQNQKKLNEEHESIPPNLAAGGKDELASDGKNESSVLSSSNPNPNSANRVSSSRGGDWSRWVQVSQPKAAHLEKNLVYNSKGGDKDGEIQSVAGNVDNGKVYGVKKNSNWENGRNGGDDKGIRVRNFDDEGKCAGSPLSSGNGDSGGGRFIGVRNMEGRIRGGGGRFGGRAASERRNQKEEDVVQLRSEGEGEKILGSGFGSGIKNVGDNVRGKWDSRRNEKNKDVIESQPVNVSERRDQKEEEVVQLRSEGDSEKGSGFGVGSGNKNVCDNVGGKWDSRRNYKNKGVVESQSGKGVLNPNDDCMGKTIPEQGFEDARENKNVGDTAMDKCNYRKFNQKKGVVQLPSGGGALGPSDCKKDKKIVEIGFDDGSGNQKGNDDARVEQKKKKNRKKKNVVKLQQDGGALDPNDDGEDKKIPELGCENVSGSKNVDDNVRGEIKGQFGGLSLSGGKEESSSGRSSAVRIRQRQQWIKGDHGKFGRPNDDSEDKKIQEQRLEVESVNKNVDKNTWVEIEGNPTGVPLSRGTRESSGGRSIGVQNQRGEIKGGRGGRSICKSYQARLSRGCDGRLVWVKKEEVSQIGVVPMEKDGNK